MPRPRDPLAEIIGRNVWAARIAVNMHQGEVGEIAGLSGAMVCRIELGERMPSITTLVSIAKALGVAPGLLLKGTSDLG